MIGIAQFRRFPFGGYTFGYTPWSGAAPCPGSLQRETHPAEKCAEARIGAQGVERRIDLQEGYPFRPSVNCFLQPSEGLVSVAQISIDFTETIPAEGIGTEFRKHQFPQLRPIAVRSILLVRRS